MISPILPSHDADTIALDLGIFIARQSRHYRCSPDAVRAVIRDALPSQPATSQAHAPVADTRVSQAAGETTGGEVLPLASSPVEPISDACPDDPNGQHFIGCGCDHHNPDQPETAEPVLGPAASPADANEGGENVDPPSELTHADTLHERAGGPGSAVGFGAPIDGEKRPTIKAQVFDTHYAHPDWTAQQIAEHIGAKVGSVKPALFDARARRNAELAIIEPVPVPNPQKPVAPPPPPSGWTLRERVRIVHSQHPNWTAALISKHLGANLNSVSTYLATIRGRVQTSAPSTPARVLPNGQAGEIEMNARNEAAARAARLGKPS